MAGQDAEDVKQRAHDAARHVAARPVLGEQLIHVLCPLFHSRRAGAVADGGVAIPVTTVFTNRRLVSQHHRICAAVVSH